MPRRIMDYPAYFGGWHSIISGGHFLSVLGFMFFILMLLDSLYEGAAPSSKTLGVPRLNTRLAFYTYERARLSLSNTSSNNLNSSSGSEMFMRLPTESTLIQMRLVEVEHPEYDEESELGDVTPSETSAKIKC